MRLCTECLHVDDRKVDHCPQCAGSAFAKVTTDGEVIAVPAEAGMPCSGCFRSEHDLKLRYYRRILGLVFMDRIWAEAGYYCPSCRRRKFAFNMAFTGVLGWWSLGALFFRNPFAIFVNLWALFASPFGAREMGAMNVNDIRAQSAADEARDERLADVYMRMPGWMESLSDEDVKRILIPTDQYEVLGVSVTATHVEIKSAWREQARANHPDLAGTSGHERMVAINEAWEVLGDERLRHAYDHRDELLNFLQEGTTPHQTLRQPTATAPSSGPTGADDADTGLNPSTQPQTMSTKRTRTPTTPTFS